MIILVSGFTIVVISHTIQYSTFFIPLVSSYFIQRILFCEQESAPMLVPVCDRYLVIFVSSIQIYASSFFLLTKVPVTDRHQRRILIVGYAFSLLWCGKAKAPET